MRHFPIPPSATRLVKVPDSELDLRPDALILAELLTFRPVTSEKNVWAFWDRGLASMYPSYTHTVTNWVRKLAPAGWTVRVLDLVPSSPNNISNFISPSTLPDCLVEGTMTGPHRAQHASDLVRLPLLSAHGGVWMDVGNMLHTHLDTLFWNALSPSSSSSSSSSTSTNTPYELGLWLINGQIRRAWGSFGNFMLAARKNSPFIANWHAGFSHLWRGRTSSAAFHAHPLVREVGVADGMADWSFADKIPEMSDYVAQMLIGDRTRNLVDPTTGFDGRDVFHHRAFLVEGIRNGILGAVKTDYSGARQVDLFTTSLAEPDEARRRAAEEFVVDVLENSHMYKVYHNSAGGPPALGDLIKQDAFKDATHRPGTFGEMYRYGTVHWRSTREVERVVPPPSEEELIRATPTMTEAECRQAESRK
ncbi:putative glycosyl transferase FCK3 [Colletotrichum orbiculare MAFF 240422]|uniref:Glycosyl transferase FCK3 n=1 Tax=Colletotrichum orbiculare (strain 104-T / ATCC 96160 / CBS 514.97 / LARS 414 / MAFF 240422) TaxID=1213857 RepID=N4VKV8_COLOR|nr:putative glycosyl transferase FCK3 [Colletotrichum orbiculare MAFF 240422]